MRKRHIVRVRWIRLLTVLTSFIIMCAMISFVFILLYDSVFKPLNIKASLYDDIHKLEEKISQLNDEVDMLRNERSELKHTIFICIQQLDELKTNYEELVNTYEDNISQLRHLELDEFRYYMDLYNRYTHVFEYGERFPRVDFGLSELVFLDKTAAEFGVPTGAMLSVYELESSFISTLKNSASTATGYGQVLDWVAVWLHERMLGLGEYDIDRHHDLAVDKELNIKMSTKLMAWNIERFNGDIKSAIEFYYGDPDPEKRQRYLNIISRNLANYGYTFDNVIEKDTSLSLSRN